MKGTVFVSGGSGYIAGFLIRRLVAEGFTVHATLRSRSREPALRELLAVDDSRLHFFEADLLADAGWDAAMAGCTHAAHVASPLQTGMPKSADELVVSMSALCAIWQEASMGEGSDVGGGRLPWRDAVRGGWLNLLAPSITLFVTIIGESAEIPGWVLSATVATVWLGGFFNLVRVQFALRHRNQDVFRAFWLTTALGFALVALLLAAMFVRGRA